MAKVELNLQRGRTDGIVSTRSVPCVRNVPLTYYLRVFAMATWLGGCAHVLANCLLPLMSTIFLIKQVCAAEMAVRYAALCACLKVRR